MIAQDLVNGMFGLIASILAYQNIREAIKHKEIKGVHWASTGFFTCWGIWNLYFYPYLGMWFSFVGSLSIVFIDIWWLTLFYRYRHKGTLR